MTYDVPFGTSLWEVAASIQVAQAYGSKLHASQEAADLVACADLDSGEQATGALDYAAAYRWVDACNDPYAEVLASVSGITGMPLSPPHFPKFDRRVTLGSGGIVVCPFPPRNELALPEEVWRAVVHYLRGFGTGVVLLGGKGQWQDACSYTEDEIMSEQPVADKLAKLEKADLVVGVPNEWTWAAAGMMKPLVYFYPHNVPDRRWFAWGHENLSRALFRADQLATPVVLYSLKQAIEAI